MPFKSEAQRAYFNANRLKLEKEGVNVHEWNEASRGKVLPKKKEEKKPRQEEKPAIKAYYHRRRG